MKAEYLEYLNTILLTSLIFFIGRFFTRVDKTEKKVEVLEDRVLTIEIEKKTEKEIKVAHGN